MIVKPSGGKLWRLKHRRVGNERQLTIGRYPDVGLKEARDVTILREAQGVTGAGRYVFHGQRAVALDA
jgi:hypothetical protein